MTIERKIDPENICECTCETCRAMPRHEAHPCSELNAKPEPEVKSEAKKLTFAVEFDPQNFVETANLAMQSCEKLMQGAESYNDKEFDSIFEVFQQCYKTVTSYRAKRKINTRLRINGDEYEANKHIKVKSAQQIAEEKREKKQTEKIEKRVQNKNKAKELIPGFDPNVMGELMKSGWCTEHKKWKLTCGCK